MRRRRHLHHLDPDLPDTTIGRCLCGRRVTQDATYYQTGWWAPVSRLKAWWLR